MALHGASVPGRTKESGRNGIGPGGSDPRFPFGFDPMADVFISYAKKHAQLTQDLARDIEAKGFTTWWDTSLLPGDGFPEKIKQEIDVAKAVIVVWTESSVTSSWVWAEADRAYKQSKLITVHEEGLDLDRIPLPFNRLQSSLVTDRAKVFAALARCDVGVGRAPEAVSSVENPAASGRAKTYKNPAQGSAATVESQRQFEQASAGNMVREPSRETDTVGSIIKIVAFGIIWVVLFLLIATPILRAIWSYGERSSFVATVFLSAIFIVGILGLSFPISLSIVDRLFRDERRD